MNDNMTVTIGFLIIVFIFIVGVIFAILPAYNEASIQETKNITITEKIPSHGQEGKYLVIDDKENVYQVSDAWCLMIFDASDRYAELHEWKTYKVRVGGVRNNFFSWYPNILTIYGESND